MNFGIKTGYKFVKRANAFVVYCITKDKTEETQKQEWVASEEEAIQKLIALNEKEMFHA